MDIMELGAIGELVGGVAVLATLLYLALQVRQGNHIARQNASQALMGATFELAGRVAVDRGLAEVWAHGEDRFDELDATDQQRLVFYEWRGLESFHNSFHQHRSGLLPDYQWRKQQWVYRNAIGKRQAVVEAWRVFRESYDEEFRAVVDGILRREQPGTHPH